MSYESHLKKLIKMIVDSPTKALGRWMTALFVVLIVSGTIYYFYIQFFRNPCGLPVKYSIGNVDERFQISTNSVVENTKDAAERWNAQIGETVLEYDQNSKLKVNLIYDERQVKIDRITSEIGSLDSSGNSIDSLRKKVENLITQYQKDLADYDQEIKYWNSQGGAPKETFDKLEAQQQSLESRRLSINQVAGLLNQQIDQHNSNLDQVNSEIDKEKNKIITQGLYYPIEKKIDIFTFGNDQELRLVAMHELGHALSLGHDDHDKSILYPILGSQDLDNPTLSEEDLQVFEVNCKSFSAIMQNMIYRLKNIFDGSIS